MGRWRCAPLVEPSLSHSPHDTRSVTGQRQSGECAAVSARGDVQSGWTPPRCRRARQAGTLDHFLTERYSLYHQYSDGRSYKLDIHHRPWPLHCAPRICVSTRCCRSTGSRPKSCLPGCTSRPGRTSSRARIHRFCNRRSTPAPRSAARDGVIAPRPLLAPSRTHDGPALALLERAGHQPRRENPMDERFNENAASIAEGVSDRASRVLDQAETGGARGRRHHR